MSEYHCPRCAAPSRLDSSDKDVGKSVARRYLVVTTRELYRVNCDCGVPPVRGVRVKQRKGRKCVCEVRDIVRKGCQCGGT